MHRTSRGVKGVLSLMVTTAASVVLSVGTGAAAAAPAELPVDYSQEAALAYAATHTNQPPPGANDWKCRPSREHPRPVILTHGSLANMAINWFTLSPLLVNHGFCVYALNYGQQADHPVGYPGAFPAGATAGIPQSANELKTFVDRVRDATGADEVDIVGHSQGGLMPRYYLKDLDGAAAVHSLVGLAPPNHGHTPDPANGPSVSDTALDLFGGQAAADELTGSAFLDDLNRDGDTVADVTYTVIASRDDTVVTPYTSAFLDGPNVTNILLQDRCPAANVSHGGLAYDRYTLGLVLHALDDRIAEPTC